MASTGDLQQFVLLPTRGFRGAPSGAGTSTRRFLGHLHDVSERRTSLDVPALPPSSLRVLDSVSEDGAKLVEMSSEAVSQMRAQQPGIRIVPLVYFYPAVRPRPELKPQLQAMATGPKPAVRLKIVSKTDHSPIVDAEVFAFLDFEAKEGVRGTTNSQGEVSLSLGNNSTKLDRLYVYPKAGFWSTIRHDFSIEATGQIELLPLNLAHEDALRHFYPDVSGLNGIGVKVAVVDTGVGPHSDIVIREGENTVVGEDPADCYDNGCQHGTHVAGIVAGRGRPPKGVRGVAPEVELYSYRVFGKGIERASNYSIAKAIDHAAAAGCDLINLSLAGGPSDPAISAAISDARARGAVCIAAAGNEYRSAVGFPAALPLAVAVSAFGRKRTFPPDATETGDVAEPYGSDADNFVAAFSNIGPEIDLTAPGVGIVSCVPGGYCPMSGTSMACPVVTGFAGCLLSNSPDVLDMARDDNRADEIVRRLFASAEKMNFGEEFEGAGMPRL